MAHPFRSPRLLRYGQGWMFFRKVGELHPKYRTPVVSLMVQMVWDLHSVRLRQLRSVARLHCVCRSGVLIS